MSMTGPALEKPKVSPLYDPRVRGIAFQVALVLVLGFLLWEAGTNAATNMRARGIPTNFDFWNRTAGFDINLTLISYSAVSEYGRAFWVGLLNTLLVAGIGVVLATFLGFTVGIARLSRNWLVSKLATVYVETIRNVPLLLQLLFWYNAVLKPLPGPRDSLKLPGLALTMPSAGAWVALLVAVAGAIALRALKGRPQVGLFAPILIGAGGLAFLAGPYALSGWGGNGLLAAAGSAGVFVNNRGLILPEPKFDPGADWVGLALLLAIAASAAYAIWARRQQMRTGAQHPVGLVTTILVIGLPFLVFLIAGRPIALDAATLRGFNYQGGVRVLPEFVALLMGLVLYTAAFISEIVRAGIQSVAKGQTEAAHALGLRPGPTLKLVVVPQAMRVIVPPLTNQYLNLTKNSSLAVFIGYPDLVQVFAGTVLNQTGAAVQVISITMGVYLLISLATSFIMGFYNRSISLRER